MHNARPLILTKSLSSWDQNLAGYSESVSASGGTGSRAYSFMQGQSLPAGLILNQATGVIGGTPTVKGELTVDTVSSLTALAFAPLRH